MNQSRSAVRWLWCSLAVLLCDQLTKWLAFEHLQYRLVKVLPVLNFSLALNRGAAFSFLSNAGGWQMVFFSLLALVVSVAIVVWLLRMPAHKRLQALALSLVLGGALGNMIDRVRFGYVIDFIDFHIGSWHYATFNVADIGICVGAFLLVVNALFFKREIA